MTLEEMEAAADAYAKAHPKPQFDAIEPEQERLVIEYCAELSRLAQTGVTVDAVTLLEWASALYKAEMFPPGPIIDAAPLGGLSLAGERGEG